MKFVILYATLFFTLNIATAYAEEIPKNLFNSLQSLLGIENNLHSQLEKCLDKKKYVTAEDLIRDNPKFFSGITSTSEKWPDIVKLHEDYHKKTCYIFNEQKLSRIYTESILSHYTVAEARELEQYLKTAQAKKLLDSSVLANAALIDEISKTQKVQLPKISKWYVDEFKKIISRKKECNKP